MVKVKKVKKFVIKTYDGDMYVVEGYESASEIREKLLALDWVTMPNGDEIKPNQISKIQAVSSYQFQAKQKSRHKIGQYIGRGGKWYDHTHGAICDAELESITGKMKEIPALKSGESTGTALPAPE